MCFGDLFMTGVVKNWKRLQRVSHGLEIQHPIEATTELLSEASRKVYSGGCEVESLH